MVLTFAFVVLSSCAGPDLRKAKDARDVFLKENPNALHLLKDPPQPLRYAAADAVSKKMPLLFIHGSPGSWEGWAEFLLNPELRSRFNVVALDRPGYGGSNGGEPERSLAKQAQAVARVLKSVSAEGAPPAILVGHSYGGPVAVRAAIDYPELVGGIVLVAAAVSSDLEETKWYQHVADGFLFRWMVPRDLDVCNQEIMALKSSLQEMAPLWERVRCGVSIIHGDKDSLVPVENATFARAKLTAARSLSINVVVGMNHFVPWEHPELIVDAVLKLGLELFSTSRASFEKDRK